MKLVIAPDVPERRRSRDTTIRVHAETGTFQAYFEIAELRSAPASVNLLLRHSR